MPGGSSRNPKTKRVSRVSRTAVTHNRLTLLLQANRKRVKMKRLLMTRNSQKKPRVRKMNSLLNNSLRNNQRNRVRNRRRPRPTPWTVKNNAPRSSGCAAYRMTPVVCCGASFFINTSSARDDRLAVSNRHGKRWYL